MKITNTLCIIVLTAFAFSISGCGQSNPNANVPKEKIAPAPEDVAKNPGYAEQFGGQDKK